MEAPDLEAWGSQVRLKATKTIGDAAAESICNLLKPSGELSSMHGRGAMEKPGADLLPQQITRTYACHGLVGFRLGCKSRRGSELAPTSVEEVAVDRDVTVPSRH